MHDIADFIPVLDNDTDIHLLIGRDMLPAHHVIDYRHDKDRPHLPFAHKLKLGWVIIGQACLDGVHTPTSVDVLKTVLRPTYSILASCDNRIHVSEDIIDKCDIFQRKEDDNKPGLSLEDKKFLSLMDNEMKRDESGKWMAPLPFKNERPYLPNNRKQALDRARSLDQSLRKDSVKKEHFHVFMQALLDSGHAELAPQLELNQEHWYLPLFGVYHPQKKDRIRGVFDSSAKTEGVSLNSVLMTGPDLMNSLLGVLLRFRRETVGIMADIEKMFYCFSVRDDHRKYLRFIWHQDNDFEKPLVDFQMTVHVFGNSPSPAVATCGLRKTADIATTQYGPDVKSFVDRNFYVDDALSSHATADEGIDLLHRTKSALSEFGNLRLHKISSNSSDVLAAFDNSELAKELTNIELGNEGLPIQRSLGLCWNLQEDKFTFQITMDDKPFTRRGVLSSVNSLFDPLGFVAPVTIAGKAILREAMTEGSDWDEPLSESFQQKWEFWKSSLKHLESLRIPRCYGDMSLSQAVKKELCIFSDASLMAIAAVVYLKLTDNCGDQTLGFVMGKAKLAPKHGHTVPRLELCAAVLATELYETVRKQLDINFDSVKFFTDSKVVLGYITNETKRFFTYVENRVERIRSSSNASDWNYIPTKLNPADEGTRSVPACDMEGGLWLRGPTSIICDSNNDDEYPLVAPDDDKEVRVFKTDIQEQTETTYLKPLTDKFERFSSWCGLIRTISLLKHIASSRNKELDSCNKWHLCDLTKTPEAISKAEQVVIQAVQNESYSHEIEALKSGKRMPLNSSIRNLDR